MSYQELLNQAKDGDFRFGHTSHPEEVPSGFWEHIERVTDIKFSQDHREGIGFRCAC